MRKPEVVVPIFFMVCSLYTHSQEFMKKIELKEGETGSIKYKELNIGAILQISDANSAEKQFSLEVTNNGESIAEFYIYYKGLQNVWNTKIYKNYFLTFMIESDNQYLIIEQAQLGKAFFLSKKESGIIGTKDDSVKIEITDFYHGWYDDPIAFGREEGAYDEVHYNLKMEAGGVSKNFGFIDSEIKDGLVFALGGYDIQILSDIYDEIYPSIEMIIQKNHGR